MGEKSVNTNKNVDACGSSEAKMKGTNGNMDLLIATLGQISAFQNRNSQTPSGYFPLTGMHAAHQEESRGQFFSKTQQLNLVDRQELDPDLALQLWGQYL